MLSTVTDYNDSLLLLNYPRLIGEGLSNEVSKFIQEQWWK
ncbi:Uncharacterised protein [Mannheimia haemolytica]|uniref:Uncharacterized protein n=1 Tax=Mannheimia haemolytica TaxID=75985 RepID=A0A378MT16_MANHA|nr:Uncharacterised protein [Mannheimia haemolytica]